MKFETFTNGAAMSQRAADILLSTIRGKRDAVLALPTGRTPIEMYRRVVGVCSSDYHCFADVSTFNLDEYVGIPSSHPASYCSFMHEHLFDHVDIDPENTHIPNGMAADLDAECASYEAAISAAGGLDVAFLGLGRNGHIGFNEPGTPFDSRTRVVDLTESTRHANSDLFPDGRVPHQAITMGIGTILSSRRIVLLVSGSGKEEAIARLRSGEISESFPASALWKHEDVRVLLVG